jgi:uncharacterized protein (TIGR04141 family)
MPRPPRQRPLSIYLVKESVRGLEDAVKNPDAVEWFDVDPASGVTGILAIGQTSTKTPWWSAYLSAHVEEGEALLDLANRSTSALLLIEAADRFFAFAFGYGRHLLDPEAYEQDFGLKVALNTVDADLLMSVDARTIDELTMHTRRDVSRGSPFAAFGLDVTRDLIRAVTGPPQDQSFGRRATGSDALALLSVIQFPELPGMCERLLAAYDANEYKARFGWIDHLRRVREPSLVENLNELLLQKVRNQDLVDIHLAPPEPMPWERLEGFTFSTRSADELDSDPRITAYLETIDTVDDLELADLKKDRVVAISAETNLPLETWSVFRCIVFEVREEETLYVLTAGNWYRVSASFADEVMQFAEALPELGLPLPDAPMGIGEGEYNQAAAEELGALSLDKQLVVTPAGDRIELCDLLTRERQLIHVKKRGSSATLSHLFSQGLVSAELLAREPAFRQAVRAKVSELGADYEGVLPEDRPVTSDWEVGFVVITRSQRETPLTLPFFSLVNLRSAVLRLQDLGYRVSVRRVDET